MGKIKSMFNSSRQGAEQSKKTSHEFLSEMVATGRPVNELASGIQSIAIVAAVELSQCGWAVFQWLRGRGRGS